MVGKLTLLELRTIGRIPFRRLDISEQQAELRVGIRTPKSLDVFSWIRNAFDVRYFEQLSVQSGNTGLVVGQPGDFRTWGGSIRLRF